MPIELRHLRYFIAVAQEGHITRASEKLGIQQPPLSQQIKALEGQLGAQLFRRKARGVELTHAGRAFLEDALKIMTLLERAVETTQRTARGEEGRICVGVTPTAPFHPFVINAIRRFRDACPNVALTMEESLSEGLFASLRDERIDVAFVRSAVADAQGLRITRLPDEPMLVALPTDHKLAREPLAASVLLKQLAGEVFVLYGPPGSGIHGAIIAACHRAGFAPRIGQLTPRITSTLGFVAAGLGISLVTQSMRSVGMEGVSYRALKGSAQPRALLNLLSRRGDPSGVVRQFLQSTRTQVSGL